MLVNVITGRGSVSGNCILEHPGFRKLGFTGSTEVGYTIADAAARKLIPATLELGGKSANIYFPDAPWEKAIEGVMIGILFNQGQVCCAGSRVFVHEQIYDRFLAECVAAFNKVKVGLPWEKDTQMGAIVNGEQLQKILAYVEVGQKEGAKVACGGAHHHGRAGEGRLHAAHHPRGADNKMRVAQEEIFGPVATFIKFTTEEEVMAMANDSEYGLGGAVWTQDINRAFRVARGMETGRMWVNNYNNLPAHTPFGGYKKSGIGRETHKMILEHLTQKKNIFISMTETKVGLYLERGRPGRDAVPPGALLHADHASHAGGGSAPGAREPGLVHPARGFALQLLRGLPGQLWAAAGTEGCGRRGWVHPGDE